MKSLIGSFIGLVFVVVVGAEPLIEGRVRLDSGEPVANAQVQIFDMTDLRQGAIARATTDATGHFALSLQAFAHGSALPQGFALGQNYPNPFNPSTIVPYQLPTATHVRLEVFNLLGQRVATLVDGQRSAGTHTAQWDATDAAGQAVAAGVYIYRLLGGEVSVSRRMVLIDGQAGVPAAVAGPVRSAVERLGVADRPVYGLTVAGAGLVAYVNPAFRVGVDAADIVLEAHGSLARMKLTTDRILGDVNNDGQVDAFDALYVLLYSEDSSIDLPNNGDISLGDVNGDGTVDVADALLLATYSVNPSDPSLPAGIGEPVDATTTTASQMWKLYWTDSSMGKIQRSNLDGSEVEDLVGTPYGGALALDVSGGKLYWTSTGTDKIQRSNLDGSEVEDLVTTGLVYSYGLALDVAGGKMYWTIGGTGKIQRSNLDGSEVEDLVPKLRFPYGLALDVSGGKMYWTDWNTEKIQRSNLDGSKVEDLVTDLYYGYVALDVSSGKMYWINGGRGKIQRSNLDGSEVEDLVTTGTPYGGLALDVSSGKMYWKDNTTIQRSNLDGSDVEDLVSTGSRAAESLALGLVPIEVGSDLEVLASVSDRPTPGQSFTLSVTVRNRGTEQAAATTLRYYRSDNATIGSADTPLGTAAVNSLASLAERAYSIDLTAPTSTGTYYYGACVESVAGERRTYNNCTGTRVRVISDPNVISTTISGCSGTSNLSMSYSTITLDGTVHAYKTVSDVSIIGRYDDKEGLPKTIGDLSAGQSKRFTVYIAYPTLLSFLDCSLASVRAEYTSGSAKVIAGEVDLSEQIRVQGSSSASSALINRKRSIEQFQGGE